MTRWVIAVALLGTSVCVSSFFQQTDIHGLSRPVMRREWVGVASWCGGGERLNRHVAKRVIDLTRGAFVRRATGAVRS